MGTKSVKLCIGTACTLTPGLSQADYERRYQDTFKPLVSSLYNLPEVFFTLYLSGSLIDWLERYHPEFFMILEEMAGRKQIDILGGGYYAPLFPLIPPADRVAQIELLTTTLRKHFGKRPRGAWITASAWEPGLIASLNTCGIEYILLDKIMIETAGYPGADGFSPVSIEDTGKTITAIPLDNRYRNPETFTPEAFHDEIASIAFASADRVVTVFIDQDSIAPVFARVGGKSWVEQLMDSAHDEKSPIELSTTSRVLKNRTLLPRAYVSSGMSPFEFVGTPPTDDIRILCRTNPKYCLVKSPCLMNLYAKMTYVHILANQLRGDKSRKKNAREELLQAQNGEVFQASETHNPASRAALRNRAYHCLLIAEKQARVRGVFSPSINTFDFDMDGQKEYLCQLESLNAYVHAKGGRIFELDVMSVYRNYCDSCQCDSGLFKDDLISADETGILASGTIPISRKVFSDTLYQEISVDPLRQEIQLKATGLFGSLQQPVSLRKQYSFRNEEIQVQYIIKNESPLSLSGTFLVELDLSLLATHAKQPVMAVYAHDNRQDKIVSEDHFTDVSWIRIDETETGSRFTVDANENPSISIFPFYADGREGAKASELGGLRLFLYWKIDLSPNFETEKMVFLKINGASGA
jgi:4-alpha-glucanotransferase